MNICEGQEYWVVDQQDKVFKAKFKENAKTKFLFFKTKPLFEREDGVELRLDESEIKNIYNVEDNLISTPAPMKIRRLRSIHVRDSVEKVIYNGLDINGQREIVIYQHKKPGTYGFEFSWNLIVVESLQKLEPEKIYAWGSDDYYMRSYPPYSFESTRYVVGKFLMQVESGDYLFSVNGIRTIIKARASGTFIEQNIYFELDTGKEYWIVLDNGEVIPGFFVRLGTGECLKYIFKKRDFFLTSINQQSIHQVFPADRPSPIGGPLYLTGKQVAIVGKDIEVYGELLYQGEGSFGRAVVIYKDSETEKIKALSGFELRGLRIYRIENYQKYDKYEVKLKNGEKETFYKGEKIVRDLQENKYFVIKNKSVIKEFLEVDVIVITKNKEEFNG
jgi:hypothetical protein